MDLLEARQLRAFTELARRGSFTEAANQLHVTQSAISHSIKSLENELQVTLFERLGKQVRITEEGEALLPHAEAILRRMEKARSDVINVTKPGHGRLRIGSSVTVSQYVLPSILRELRECFPKYEYAITTSDNGNLVELLEAGQIDIAVGIESVVSPRLTFTPLFEDRIEMAMSPRHPLAEKEFIDYEDIAGEDFIIFASGSVTYRIIDQIFSGMNGRFQPTLQVGSMDAIKEMAKIGLGIGLLAPWIALREIENRSLVFRPLPVGNASRNWGVYTDRRREQSIVDGTFSGICRNIFKNLQVKIEQLEAAG